MAEYLLKICEKWSLTPKYNKSLGVVCPSPTEKQCSSATEKYVALCTSVLYNIGVKK